MGRSLRPWWFALIVSLLLHGLLIGNTVWQLPQWVAPSPPSAFDVRLQPVASPGVAPSARPPVPPPPVRAKPVEPRAVDNEPTAAESDVAESVPPATDSVPPPLEPPVLAPEAPDEPPVPVAASRPLETAAPIPPVAPAPAPLNVLPPRVDLRFRVTYGMASGEQTLVWVNESGTRYTVVSVAEATGLAGLFYRGKFVQTSRGRMTPLGLQPEEFWDQRGDKRSSAQFDPERGKLMLNPARGAPRHFSYQGEVQDVLSLFFQLALTAPPATDALRYTVFNGKKLRDYRYEVRGITRLETAAGPLRTLHLARVADGDGRFEVWLAVDRHYLPVRVLKSDEQDSEIELSLLSMTY